MSPSKLIGSETNFHKTKQIDPRTQDCQLSRRSRGTSKHIARWHWPQAGGFIQENPPQTTRVPSSRFNANTQRFRNGQSSEIGEKLLFSFRLPPKNVDRIQLVEK